MYFFFEEHPEMTSALTYFKARLILSKQQLHLKAKRWKEKLLKSSFLVRGFCPARLRAARLCSLLFCQLLGFPATSFPGTGCSLGSPSKGQGSSPCLSLHLLHGQQIGEVINAHMFSYSNYEFALLSLLTKWTGLPTPSQVFPKFPHSFFG